MKITTKEIYLIAIVNIEEYEQQLILSIEEVVIDLEELKNKAEQLATLILKCLEVYGRLPAEIVVDRSPAVRLVQPNCLNT